MNLESFPSHRKWFEITVEEAIRAHESLQSAICKLKDQEVKCERLIDDLRRLGFNKLVSWDLGEKSETGTVRRIRLSMDEIRKLSTRIANEIVEQSENLHALLTEIELLQDN